MVWPDCKIFQNLNEKVNQVWTTDGQTDIINLLAGIALQSGQ